MSLLGEIKRRKVFQVAAVYAVVAWLIIQVVDVVSVPLNLPDWFATVAIVMLAIGFPIAVILAWIVDMTPRGPKIDRGPVSAETAAPASGQRMTFAIQGLVLLAVGLLVADQYLFSGSTAPAGNVDIEASASTSDDTRVRRWTVNLGRTTGRTEVTVSPNGSRIVYSISSMGSSRQLYTYLDQLDPQPIPRTERAQLPFFSPTGEWIGFDAGPGNRSQLKRASIRGGPPETLTDEFNRIYGASWGDDDSIIFSTTDDVTGDVGFLVRVSAAEGWSPEVLTTPEPGTSHLFPDVLPGSEAALFTIRMPPGPATESSIALLDLETGEHRALLSRGYNAKYVPTGHIVFVRDTTLFAAPFDLEAMAITGTEFPVVDGLSVNSQLGWAPYDFSTDGLFVYVRGSDVSALGPGPGETLRSLVWVDRDGVEEPLPFPPRAFSRVGLSRDDRRLAVTVKDQENHDIWIYDLAGETSPIRLTFGAGQESDAVWMPGDEGVVYSLDGDNGGMFWKAADGTGREIRLTTSLGLHIPETFAPNGQLIYRQTPRLGITGETATDGATDLHVLTIEDEEVVSEALRQTQFAEAHSTVSPNGRFIAYESTETGSSQVIVRPFPNVEDGRWQISTEGGGEPLWGPFGDELFFVDFDNATLMVTPVETEVSFSHRTPIPLIDGAGYRLAIGGPSYAISSDGQRFLVMKTEVAASDTTLAVVENWFEEIRRREATE